MMTNSSPEVLGPRGAGQVLRGPQVGVVATAQFDTDLRRYAAEARATGTSADQSRAVGYAAGWSEGRKVAARAAAADAARVQAEIARLEAEAEATRAAQAAQVRQALGALGAAATRLDQRATPDLEELEQTIVAAAFALAEAVVGRELACAVEPGLEAIARALSAAPSGGPVTVRLCPADLATITGTGGVAGQIEMAGRNVLVVTDPVLRPGDAVAQCDTTTVDARIGAALDRIREVLFGAAE